MRWDASGYDDRFGFVTEYGTELLELLEVEPPAALLDVGCGTGTHAAVMAGRGFDVLGVDQDAGMIARAARLHPQVRFVTEDVQTMKLDRTFDAAISNAALHWMTDQAAALRSIRAALNPGAQFVAEMGGKDNVATIDGALTEAVSQLGLTPPPIRKFFPSVGEQAALLESAGFAITYMKWFPRPTRLAADQTPAAWTRLFRADVWATVPPSLHVELAARVDAASEGLRDEQGWFIDYHRLRFSAVAV
ncbi:MAG: methyltransferase domain-containing protein [Candidatus Nanopelagicales bacterium]